MESEKLSNKKIVLPAMKSTWFISETMQANFHNIASCKYFIMQWLFFPIYPLLRPRIAWPTFTSWTRCSFDRQCASTSTKTLSITLWTSCMHCWASAWSPLPTVSMWCACEWDQMYIMTHKKYSYALMANHTNRVHQGLTSIRFDWHWLGLML